MTDLSHTPDAHDELARQIAERHLGRVSRIEVRRGQANPVYFVEALQGRRVLKLFLSSAPASKEYAVLSQLANGTIPLPSIEGADVQGREFGMSYLLLVSAGSETAADFFLSGRDGSAALAAEMGMYLARLHGLATYRLKAFDAALFSPPDPASLVQQTNRVLARLVADDVVPHEAAQRIAELSPPPVQGNALCHMDFHGVQCVVRDKHVAAIVDWEHAWLAAPEIDLAVAHAYFDFYGCERDADEFLTSYARHRALDRESYDAVALPVRILHVLRLANHWLDRRQPASVSRCRELIGRYMLEMVRRQA